MYVREKHHRLLTIITWFPSGYCEMMQNVSEGIARGRSVEAGVLYGVDFRYEFKMI